MIELAGDVFSYLVGVFCAACAGYHFKAGRWAWGGALAFMAIVQLVIVTVKLTGGVS